MNLSSRGSKAHQGARRITAQVPDRRRYDAFRPTGQPVVWRFHVLEPQPFHGQFPGIHPLQLGRGGSSLGLSEQRRAAQSEEKLSAIHAATSLPKDPPLVMY